MANMNENKLEGMPFSVNEDPKVKEYSARLAELRKNGATRMSEISESIAKTKRNKLLESKAKAEAIASFKAEMAIAKSKAKEKENEIRSLSKEAVGYVNTTSAVYEKAVKEDELEVISKAKAECEREIEQIKADLDKQLVAIKERFSKDTGKTNKVMMETELNTAKYEANSAIYDAKSRCQTIIDRSRAAIVQAYVDRVLKNRSLRGGKTDLFENNRMKFENYKANFKLSKFLLNNGLYIAIIIFFIVCIIIAPISGNGNLFSIPNLLTILEQSSTRMFYALGVAGLILLAGTDLSVGRMVALGAVITGLILHPGKNIVTFFKMGPWNFTTLPMGLRVTMALAFSIALCVLFSTFAGVFTARLKIHPFISTLATQLIIYGLLFFGTSGTPVGSIDSKIKDLIGGRWMLGIVNGQMLTFPKLILPAVFAIIVAWFIWNKTTFGKNMYAVGGNSEAASVSGINVFKTTLGVFIMAGIFYGCGSFLEAFKANASAGTGQGYELDAIAACVVGGISFNGGIGKIGGAVIGVIIFTGLTYCLTFLGIDTNLQFVFKGFIIIAAVALDSVKYLKSK